MPETAPRENAPQVDDSLLRECGETVAEYGARLLFSELRSMAISPDRSERTRIYPIFARHLASAIPGALALMRAGLRRGERFAATGTAFVATIREAVGDAIDEAYPGVSQVRSGRPLP